MKYRNINKKGTVFRQTFNLFKSWIMRSLQNIILDIYIHIKICVHQSTAVLKCTNSLKHKIYRYIMPETCDFFNGLWRDSSSLIIHHDSHFVYCFGWFKCISMHVWMLPTLFDFRLLCNCLTWESWYLVMHKFTLVFGSINTFILHHYCSYPRVLNITSTQQLKQ